MPATTSLIFDVETRADRDLVATTGYPAKEGEFLPLIYQIPVAIAVGHVNGDGVLTGVDSLQSGCLVADDPCALTQEFWHLANHAPILITFNGRGFDLPVLELCALRYGCAAPKHWGDGRENTRYRYGKAHLDLMDVLSNYGGATKGLMLANLCQLLGYQGKDGMDGSMVQEYWEAGKLEEIQSYNRRDVILTYTLYLHWARIAGRLTEDLYHQAMQASKPFLDQIR